mgnify:CR=1 FL=1
MTDGSFITQIVFLIGLVGINAFFASSEIAIISLNETKIKKMAGEGGKKAKLLYRLVSEPSRFLATIQVGITLSGLLASAFAAESFADRLSKLVMGTGLLLDESIVKLISLFLITILLSYFTLVFGELVPKRIAMQKPEAVSMFAIKPLHMVLRVFNPFVRLLTFSTNFVIKLFGGNPLLDKESVTEEEIRLMVDLGEERGIIEEAEKEMIDNIFEFDNKLASEIMTHRKDIVGLPLDAKFNEVMDVAINDKFTRLLVYEGSIDNIIGILHVKDLLQYVKKSPGASFSLKDLVRKPFFVPPSKKTDQLFRELQKDKTHLAVVIDEYGGTAGIVTTEDLLEEIVGNIFDEYDEEEKLLQKIDEKTFMMDGTVSINEAEKILGINLPSDNYEILSGFLIGQLGRIPDAAERPVVNYKNLVFKIEAVENKKIVRVRVIKE